MDDLELKSQLERYHQKSFVWSLSCCANDPVEAEDVLQAVYLKILEGRAKYSGRSAFQTWLFAIIRNTAVDWRRKKRLRQFGLIKYKEKMDRNFSEESAEPSQTLVLFEQTLGELPKRQQQVLELVFYHDLTVEQAAKVMGVSIGSARTHYDRAKRRIRQLLEMSEAWNESKLG